VNLRRSPLHEEHVALGAKLVEFGGWEMPLSYPAGTIEEHLACRRRAALFDVSHLGTVRLEGSGAFELLQQALTNDLRKVSAGRAQYTHLLDPDDASVLDDIIVWWVAGERFDVMPNASNTARVRDAVGGTDVTSERAVLALQGPQAREVMAKVSGDAAAVPRFHVAEVEVDGVPTVVAGTGYTGEDGVECAVPADAAPRVWRALLAAGAEPAGLGARDTLRLESGLPLHGHELGAGITPLQAGLGWVVGWDKGDFRGRAPLERERAAGVARRLRGLLGSSRRPPRAGQDVLDGVRRVGEVTSGNFSPLLERGIALAFLEADVELGAQLAVDVRGSSLPVEVVKPPFTRLAPAAGHTAPGR
jgi:aminomethyltransferase